MSKQLMMYLPNSNRENLFALNDSESNAAFFFASYLALLLCSPKGLEDFGSKQYAAVGTYTCTYVTSHYGEKYCIIIE